MLSYMKSKINLICVCPNTFKKPPSPFVNPETQLGFKDKGKLGLILSTPTISGYADNTVEENPLLIEA